ncbi:MAG TPA: four-helix bundle copper-binding protein [Humisphaera sp.]
MSHVSPAMQKCIQECSACHHFCLSMVHHCLTKGGPHAEPDHVRLMQDCAQICQVSADFMSRGSPHHPHLCRECAEICGQCADDCRRLADDAEMRRCADACQRCADSCREMAAAMAH